MKREIKFRGQRVDNGEWVIGNLVTSEFIEYTRVVPPDKYTDNDDWIVAPDTVGQFTGLLDKNGKEIYEGDIVLSKLKRARKYDEILQICFDNSEYCGKNEHGSSTSLSLLENYHTVEVIGNIHDNPELLHPKSE